jgi:hypothetical protein
MLAFLASDGADSIPGAEYIMDGRTGPTICWPTAA